MGKSFFTEYEALTYEGSEVEYRIRLMMAQVFQELTSRGYPAHQIESVVLMAVQRVTELTMLRNQAKKPKGPVKYGGLPLPQMGKAD